MTTSHLSGARAKAAAERAADVGDHLRGLADAVRGEDLGEAGAIGGDEEDARAVGGPGFHLAPFMGSTAPECEHYEGGRWLEQADDFAVDDDRHTAFQRRCTGQGENPQTVAACRKNVLKRLRRPTE